MLLRWRAKTSLMLLRCFLVLISLSLGEEDEEMETIAFGVAADVKFDAEPIQEGYPPKTWNLKEHRKTAITKFSKSDFEKKAKIYMVERILEPDEVASILSILGDKPFSKADDFIDDLPADMIRIGPAACREWCAEEEERSKLAEAVQPVLHTRILPLVRHRFECPNCTVCNIAFRRYAAGELGQRSKLRTHYDEGYFVTASIGLDVQGLEYDGGLYVEDAGEKKLIPLKTGDALFHQHDLPHGVNVQEGRRVSMVMNFQDSSDCVPDHKAWYRRASKKGDPVAKYQLGQIFQIGTPKTERNITRARLLFQSAIDKGYGRAAVSLADAYSTGDAEASPDPEKSIQVLKAAVEEGVADATFALGRHYLTSDGGDRAEALRLLKKAAEPPMSLPMAQLTVGNVYLGEDGAAEKNMDEAVKWWRMAGDQGMPSAMGNVGAFHLNEVLDGLAARKTKADLKKKADEAEKWLRPSAAAGFDAAMYSLGVLELKYHQRVGEALAWLEKAKDAGHEQATQEFNAVRELRVTADKNKAKARALKAKN